MSPSFPGVYAVSIIIPVVATLAVAARFSVRKTKATNFGFDDWTILPPLVGFIVSASMPN